MATNSIDVRAPRSAVYDVLMDAEAYPQWVVGPRRVVHVDRAWPDPGAGFVHEEAVGPVKAQDETVVQGVDPCSEIRLRARLRPFGAEVDIRISLEDVAGGTRVVMREAPVAGPVAAVWNPVFDAALKLRNAVALGRLRRLVLDRQ